jgi:hypothetical protein
MRLTLGALIAAFLVSSLPGSVVADDKDPKAIVDKAIKAVGGEEKLSKAKAATWKSKSTLRFGENESDFTGSATIEGVDHYRAEFEGKFMDNELKGVVILSGDKGWRKFGDMVMEIDPDGLANEKRVAALQYITIFLVPLKSKDYKLEFAGEEKVADKPALGVKAVGPDGKDFTIYFDKESGLPVRTVAKVIGFMGNELTQETTHSNFKEFDGIQKATKIETKHDGERFGSTEVSDFKVLEKAESGTFDEPK